MGAFQLTGGDGTGPSLSSASPQPLGSAAAGSGTAASKDDHVHAHGNQAGGALHSAASSGGGGTAGFMSGADKIKLDALPASMAAPGPIGGDTPDTIVATGLTLTGGGSGGINAGGVTGDTTLPTGDVGWTGAAGKFFRATVSGGGVIEFTGGTQFSGAAPTPGADAVGIGAADIAGGGTGSLQVRGEAGGLLALAAAGAGAANVLFIGETLADDASITLPAPSAGYAGFVLSLMEDTATEYAPHLMIKSDGTVVLGSGVSGNFVNTDTDAKLCLFNDGGTPTIRNRLGAPKGITGIYVWR